MEFFNQTWHVRSSHIYTWSNSKTDVWGKINWPILWLDPPTPLQRHCGMSLSEPTILVGLVFVANTIVWPMAVFVPDLLPAWTAARILMLGAPALIYNLHALLPYFLLWHHVLCNLALFPLMPLPLLTVDLIMENLKSNPVLVDYAKCVGVLSLKMSFTAWTTLYHNVL